MEENLLTTDEAIKQLGTTRPTFNRWLKAGRIKGKKAGRQWRFEPAEIERFLNGDEPSLALPVSVAPLINTLSSLLENPQDIEAPTSEIARAIQLMQIIALRKGAMAFFLDLVAGSDGQLNGRYSLKIDGIMHALADYDRRLHPALTQHVKRISGMDLTSERTPQEGRIRFPVAADRTIDFLASLIPAQGGESLCLRIRDPIAATLPLATLGVKPGDETRMQDAMAKPQGLCLVGGTSQSGKTVTAYSLLHPLITDQHRIISIEDEAGITLPGVVETIVNEKLGLNLETLIRSANRQEWDVLYVNSTPTSGTLSQLLETAFTGRVIATVYMRDAISGYLALPEGAGSDTVSILTCQRLVRRVCEQCSRADAPTDEDRNFLARVEQQHGALSYMTFRQAVGCDACHGGYVGRIGLFETLLPSPSFASAAAGGSDLAALRDIAIAEGMTSMALDGVRKAGEGLTTLAEVRRVTQDLFR